MKKILLICTTSDVVKNFRKDLINALHNAGFEVHCAIGDGKNIDELDSLNIIRYNIYVKNSSLNVIGAIRYQKQIAKLVRQNNYDIVFTFMAKPNIFGVFGAVEGGAKNIYCMIEGMGRSFASTTIKNILLQKIIVRYLKKSFKYAKKIFVLNNNDKLLVEKKVIRGHIPKVILLKGNGIDASTFNYIEPQSKNTFLLIARLLREKGIVEYCKAAEIIKQEYPDAIFYLRGDEDTIKLKDIEKYINSKIIEYIKPIKDIRSIISKCNTFVLPSYYREGFPRSILEAMAIGRAIITTDTPGCSETVEEGINGFFVKPKSVESLVLAMKKMLDNPDKCLVMGKQSRKMVEEKYASSIINNQIINEIDFESDNFLTKESENDNHTNTI